MKLLSVYSCMVWLLLLVLFQQSSKAHGALHNMTRPGPVFVKFTIDSFVPAVGCEDAISDINGTITKGCDLQFKICPLYRGDADVNCRYGGPFLTPVYHDADAFGDDENPFEFHILIPYYENSFRVLWTVYDIEDSRIHLDRVITQGDLVFDVVADEFHTPIKGSQVASGGVLNYTLQLTQAAGMANFSFLFRAFRASGDCGDGWFGDCDLYGNFCFQNYSINARVQSCTSESYRVGYYDDYIILNQMYRWEQIYYGGFSLHLVIFDEDGWLNSDDLVVDVVWDRRQGGNKGEVMYFDYSGPHWLAYNVIVDCFLTQEDECVNACYGDYKQVEKQCVKCAPCPDDHYLGPNCTCLAATPCEPGWYETISTGPRSDRVCFPCTTCSQGQYAAAECSATHDAYCETCRGECGEGEYEAQACTDTTGRVCNACSVCNPLTHYKTAECTNTSDTRCVLLTICDPQSQIETAPATLTSDRQCVNCIGVCAPHAALTLRGASNITLQAGQPFVEAGYEAIDSLDGNITASVVVENPVNVNILGRYVVVYSVMNSRNRFSVVNRTVTVVDLIPPVLTLLGNTSVRNQGGVPFIDPGALCRDAFDGDISTLINTTTTPGPIDEMAAVGSVYVMTYKCEDSSGNQAAEMKRQVEIVDTMAPVFKVPDDEPLNVVLGLGDVFLDNITAVDVRDGDVTDRIQRTYLRMSNQFAVSSAQSVAAAAAAAPNFTVSGVNTSVIGIYVITYVVSDDTSNIATLSRTVSVNDQAVDGKGTGSRGVEPGNSDGASTLPIVLGVAGGSACLILLLLLLLLRRRTKNQKKDITDSNDPFKMGFVNRLFSGEESRLAVNGTYDASQARTAPVYPNNNNSSFSYEDVLQSPIFLSNTSTAEAAAASSASANAAASANILNSSGSASRATSAGSMLPPPYDQGDDSKDGFFYDEDIVMKKPSDDNNSNNSNSNNTGNHYVVIEKEGEGTRYTDC